MSILIVFVFTFALTHTFITAVFYYKNNIIPRGVMRCCLTASESYCHYHYYCHYCVIVVVITVINICITIIVIIIITISKISDGASTTRVTTESGSMTSILYRVSSITSWGPKSAVLI